MTTDVVPGHDLTRPDAPWNLIPRYAVRLRYPWAQRPIASMDSAEHHVTVFTDAADGEPGTSVIVAELLDPLAGGADGFVCVIDFHGDPSDVVVIAAQFVREQFSQRPYARRSSER